MYHKGGQMLNGEFPDAFDSMFSYRHEIHDYNNGEQIHFIWNNFPQT